MRHRIFFIMLIVCAADMAAAQEPMGKIDQARPPAAVTRMDGITADAKNGMPVFPGDLIETGKNGEIRLSVNRVGMFMIGEETEISVDELSKAGEDDDTVLRLVTGYLRVVVAKLSGSRTEVHTPTAVIGVRGTEFDAMASIDATTLVTVDEGIVDVLSQDKTTTVSKGMMLESEIGVEPGTPSLAIPREKRNWRKWRREREKRFFEKCDKIAPEFQQRYGQWAERFAVLSDRLDTMSDEIREKLGDAREAKRIGKKRIFAKTAKRLKNSAAGFRILVAKYRKVLNRVKVTEKMLNRMERHLTANKERLDPEKAGRVLKILEEMRDQRTDVKKTARETVSNIRKTSRDLRAFKRELRW